MQTYAKKTQNCEKIYKKWQTSVKKSKTSKKSDKLLKKVTKSDKIGKTRHN